MTTRPPTVTVPAHLILMLNSIFDMERKLQRAGDPANIARNIERMKDAISDLQLFYEDPMGTTFTETRSDVEATISGGQTENLIVVEVIKPIIRFGGKEGSLLVQKGIVVVSARGDK